MQSTDSVQSTVFASTVLMTTTEQWFIPLDIVMIASTLFIILLTSIFLLAIVMDKNCHTTPMMLIANTCLAMFVLGCNRLGMNIFTVTNDLKRLRTADSLCALRGYIVNSSYALVMFSFALHAFYRYMVVVHPFRLLWVSLRCQLFLIILTWMFSFCCSLVALCFGKIVYNADNQTCQVPLRFSYAMVFALFYTYMIPILMIAGMYIRLVFYVKAIRERAGASSALVRTRREVKMVRSTVIVVGTLIGAGFPYMIFILMDFFEAPWMFDFRIGFAFIDVLMPSTMLAVYQFNDPLRMSITKRLTVRINRITATTA